MADPLTPERRAELRRLVRDGMYSSREPHLTVGDVSLMLDATDERDRLRAAVAEYERILIKLQSAWDAEDFLNCRDQGKSALAKHGTSQE